MVVQGLPVQSAYKVKIGLGEQLRRGGIAGNPQAVQELGGI